MDASTLQNAPEVSQRLGLFASDRVVQGNYYENHRGQGEKYFQGDGNRWYFLTPDGGLYEQNVQDFTASRLVAQVGASVHADPSLLVAVHASTAQDVSALGQRLGLFASDRVVQGNYYEDFRGQGEKYFQGDGGQWYLSR